MGRYTQTCSEILTVFITVHLTTLFRVALFDPGPLQCNAVLSCEHRLELESSKPIFSKKKKKKEEI